MAKRSVSEPASSSQPDPLRESVDKLSQEIGLLREIMDQIREDLCWVTRNGLPIQPIEHVVVKQMALNPCAKDWGDRLVIERHTNQTFSPLESGILDHIAADLKSTFQAIAQGQLDTVLDSLDRVRTQLQTSRHRDPQVELPTPPVPQAAIPPPATEPEPPREKPPPGRLF
ncbi:MAG: hypothetical protein JWM11_3890 [Planctomycetaceae bacterium]|nr:hypothetical protein [Planctomycetaceae bacterium]